MGRRGECGECYVVLWCFSIVWKRRRRSNERREKRRKLTEQQETGNRSGETALTVEDERIDKGKQEDR